MLLRFSRAEKHICGVGVGKQGTEMLVHVTHFTSVLVSLQKTKKKKQIHIHSTSECISFPILSKKKK